MHRGSITRMARWAGLCAAAALLATPAWAGGGQRVYRVEITNLTPGQTFTPQLVATHTGAVALFTPGDPASEALSILAEGGDTAPLSAELAAAGAAVGDVTTIAGLLGPGETASVEVVASHATGRISIAAMLIPTNDTFVGLRGAALPWWGEREFMVPAWDAGSEANDQRCATIPGPRCGGEGHSPDPADGDEGFVHVGSGFHDLGELDGEGGEVLAPAHYDWNNPVARVRVRRIR